MVTVLWWPVGHPSAPGGIEQRPPLEQSFDLLVPNAPVVISAGGTPHLVHELHITNMRRDIVTLTRLRVVAAGSEAPIADLQGTALSRTLHRPGSARGASPAEHIAPAQRVVSFLWLQLPDGVRPDAVSHQLEFTVDGDEPARTVRVAGAAAPVSATAAATLGPPLSGGPWVAIYDPHLMGGHRTAIYTLDGRARIPGRFAIDWIRAPRPGAPPLGRQIDPETRNGFGADVLAVADARVASVMDDMPDNPPDALMPQERLSLEQGSGNYVALDVGDGRFVFYEHLRHRSIAVKVGDRVRKGQVIAQLGSSGSTSIGPHLHFHVSDANATLAAEGQPFVFERYEQRGAYRSITALLGGEPWLPLRAGQPRVRQRQHPAAMAVIDFD